MYFCGDVDWEYFKKKSSNALIDYFKSIIEGNALSLEQLDEIRFLIADAISIDDLSEDEIVIRNYMVGELKSLILRNYELTGEIPDFISKYQKKNTHRID
jgi:hypothetical protein